MKFTEMTLTEAAVDTTEKYNFKTINVPLSEIKIIKPAAAETMFIPSEILEGLSNIRVNTVDDFNLAYDRGSLENVEITKKVGDNERARTTKLGRNWIEAIHSGIENSISQLPGMGTKRNVYEYLKNKGIYTVSEYNNAYALNTFDNVESSDNDFKVDNNDLENIKILTERSQQESLLRVYHASVDINVAKYVYNHEWGNGPNSQAYGTGLYTCWTKSSAFDDIDIYGQELATKKDFYRDNAVRQGKHFNIDTETGEKINFRFEFLVDVKDYFNGVWSLFEQTNSEEVKKFNLNEHNFIEYQNKKFGVNVNTNGSHKAVQSYFWGFDWKSKRLNPHFESISNGKLTTKGGPCIKGIIFVGANDGDVVVVYDTYHAIPTRLSKGDAHKWYKLGGIDYLNQARLVAMGIEDGSVDFWKKAREQYLKAIDEIISSHEGASDMNETEFISTDGKTVSIVGSLERGTIEGPEANEYKVNEIYDNYTVKDCYHAKSIHLPFRSVKNLDLTNKIPAECSQLTSLATNGSRLEVRETAKIKNLPNAMLPWGTIVGGDTGTAKISIYNIGLSANTRVCNFEQAYFVKLSLDRTLIAFDDDYIRFRNVDANNVYIAFDKKDTVKRMTFENCNIKNIYFKSPKMGNSVELIELDQATADSDLTFHFDVRTDHHRSIYKEDDEVIQSEYNAEELFSMLIEHDDALPEKDEFIEQTGFNIKNIRIGDIN